MEEKSKVIMHNGYKQGVAKGNDKQGTSLDKVVRNR